LYTNAGAPAFSSLGRNMQERQLRFARAGLHKLIAGTLILATLTLAGCQSITPAAPPAETAAAAPAADLSGIHSYLGERIRALQASTAALEQAADRYYELAAAKEFDYAALWQEEPEAVVATLTAARDAWKQASPQYEQMEGIVAGTPALAAFDVILDAGASAADDPQNAAPIDLQLPDGRTLEKPGNLFGVTESTLWGTFPAFVAPDVTADWDGDGAITFGETLPDANVLKAGAAALDQQVAALGEAAAAWEPTLSDAFTALVVMTPTMSEYFGSWRDSRFVSGDASTQRDFVAISRLADMNDILGGLQVVYAQVQPLAAGSDPAQAEQVTTGLADLRAFVADIYAQEQGGRQFTPEEADLLGAEAQNRATAVTGQITQLAALLAVPLAE
jgi:hypothetical protein